MKWIYSNLEHRQSPQENHDSGAWISFRGDSVIQRWFTVPTIQQWIQPSWITSWITSWISRESLTLTVPIHDHNYAKYGGEHKDILVGLSCLRNVAGKSMTVEWRLQLWAPWKRGGRPLGRGFVFFACLKAKLVSEIKATWKLTTRGLARWNVYGRRRNDRLIWKGRTCYVSGSKSPEKEERYRPLIMKFARTATKRAMLSKTGPARASVVHRNSYVVCRG